MFDWLKEKPAPKPKPLPTPQFARGDRVRDIYGGPEMVVINPQNVEEVDRSSALDKYGGRFRTGLPPLRIVRVFCKGWAGGKLVEMLYREDELKHLGADSDGL